MTIVITKNIHDVFDIGITMVRNISRAGNVAAIGIGDVLTIVSDSVITRFTFIGVALRKYRLRAVVVVFVFE